MLCFMFPGQPLSVKEAIPDDADGTAIKEMAARLAFGDENTFADQSATEQLQLQIYGVSMSLYVLRKLRRQGVVPQLVCEHSMGIYAALAACGSILEEEAVEITARVGRAIAKMGELKKYAFGCVVGLPVATVAAVADANRVHIANYNTSRHFLLAGEATQIEKTMADAVAAGAFSAQNFPADAPLHTPLMAEVAGTVKAIIDEYTFASPAVPIYDHLRQELLTQESIASFLVKELLEPVYWERAYTALRAAGAAQFVEVGAGEALKKYNRWIDSEARG